MHKPVKYFEKAVTYAAGAAWAVFDKLNGIHQNPGFVPKWSDKPLLKSWEKQKPKLGWPRDTDSLCPKCIPEIRKQILDGKLPVEILKNEKRGEIKAKIALAVFGASKSAVAAVEKAGGSVKILAPKPETSEQAA